MKTGHVMAICQALAFATSLLGSASAQGIVQHDLLAPSSVLGRPIPYALYIPSASPAPGARWPVIYLLHGGGGGADDWLDQGHIATTLDNAIAAGRVQPLVAVLPDGGGTSWFVDNTDADGAGKVETALTSDLLKTIDSSLPTAACREGRAVAGLSMGGYGAALFAMDHPDRFATAILLSGAIATPIEANDSARIARGQEFYDGAFGNPFDYRRFDALNLFPRIALDQQRPDKPAFWITAGDQDGLGIIAGSAEFHVALRRAGYDTTLRIGPGQHNWTNWSTSIVPALEWLSPKLSNHCPTTQAAN